MARTIRGRNNGLEIWPGYVDALSTLLMVTIFVLLVFVLAEAFLSVALSSRNKTIGALRSEIAQLSQVLALQKAKTASLQDELSSMAALMKATKTREAALMAANAALSAKTATLGAAVAATGGKLAGQVELNAQEIATVSLLNQQIAALRLQLATIAAALDAAQKKDQAEHVQIADLGKQLNEALARKVQSLEQYRSEFFGVLRQALAGQKDIKVVGDRFVFESAVLFPSDSAQLSATGKAEIAKVAQAIETIAPKIPAKINWVLSVTGYADKEAITGGPYKDNFDLSAARALSVLHLLIADGVSKNRVVAAGFGANHPIATGDTPKDLAQNRRIEFRLTSAD
ncbi:MULTISPECIES: peptidoglycan -binding protein [unclassified Acidiphilium]|uniref:peptidoglycan -binding protein n=1 Tax=unclassified Acidiphilium TaxID=2617493 RepID=UPI000BD58B1D|nr:MULTISPECIES: peptidoglycan -binding protein [unclassified Acidiphilium]OYV54852.1 MAG: flagellar motor protein MotB [Acidiphilium sp. 20-67-58]HQT62334.1 peptidoglycan -binding protein [Acidiphilium sp.]